uniref:Uncharacterized protein n=1 Tax=Rhinopithecus roxellana TaxID=61622 RepID=A0A2K6PAM6_RHIRO
MKMRGLYSLQVGSSPGGLGAGRACPLPGGAAALETQAGREKHRHVLHAGQTHPGQAPRLSTDRRVHWWFFFSTVASATAGMLCLITILLYILVQYFVNPGVLRTDPNYEDVKNTNTWLLFLPLFPVQVQTLIVVIIGMVVLLLDLLGLVQLGQLLIFHIYLKAKKMTTFEYLIKTRKEESSEHQAARKDPHVQMEEGFLQQRDGALGSSTQGAKVKSSLLICKSPCHFCTSVNPDGDSILPALTSRPDPDPDPTSFKARNSLQIYRRPCPFSSTVHPEGGSTAQEADDEPSPSPL